LFTKRFFYFCPLLMKHIFCRNQKSAMKQITFFSLVLGLVFSTGTLSAQENDGKYTGAHVSNYRDWAISLAFGNTYMQGDLESFPYNPESDTRENFRFGPTGQLSATKYVNSVFGFSFALEAGIMGGNSFTGPKFNTPGEESLPSFEGFFINFTPQVVINLSGIGLRGKTTPRKWAHLAKVGIGGYYGTPELTYVDVSGVIRNTTVDGDGDENWNNSIHAALDYNLKYQLSRAFDLDFILGSRVFFNDNIDGYGNTFPAYSEFNNKSNDITFFTGLGATYNFGNKGDAEENDKISVIYTNPMDELYGDLESLKDDYDKLTSDDDDDGVSNYFDKDNSTPEGATVNGDGVAADVDEDGIPDYLDKDPFTMKGAQVDEDGLAIDTDKDGVPDAMDEEADTEEGALVNFKGITIPAGGITGGGSGSSATLPAFFFNFNSATVTSANHQRLLTLAKVLEANPDLNITLTGFADVRGPEKYNDKLGLRRADEVKDQLVQVYGVDAGRISTSSKGENTPYAKDRYDINRRVDVSID
jgi:OOP family OmpA-OmpF porin